MSNSNVGTVYEQIINEVLDSSRVDFEENGIDESVMVELKKVWTERLSSMQIATFPWDPKPEPPAPQPAPAANPPPPSAMYTQATLSPSTTTAQPGLTMPLPAGAANGMASRSEPPGNGNTHIKQEPGTYTGPPMPSFPAAASATGQSVAAARAAQQMEAQFGTLAASSIHAMKGGQPAGQQQAAHPSLPAGQAYGQHQPLQHRQQQPPNGTLGASQVDGGGDDGFEGVLTQRNADGSTVELGRVEIDRMLHDRIAANAKRMEGGGLMLPLSKASTKRSRRAAAGSTKSRIATPADAAEGSITGTGRFDGPDDDIKDEDDEDIINSDLDDPNDNDEDSDDDDDSMAQQMLCLYDKVQRVKNKWKCTLKDGILTVNNKDYVFHKATGEYEW